MSVRCVERLQWWWPIDVSCLEICFFLGGGFLLNASFCFFFLSLAHAFTYTRTRTRTRTCVE